MDMLEYREQVQRAVQRTGPRLFKVFVIYALVQSVLNFVCYFLQGEAYDWYISCYEYLSAGETLLPQMPQRAQIGMYLCLLLKLMGRVVTAGWIALTLNAARGGEYSWHDLWGSFGNFWKVFVIAFLQTVLCSLACICLVVPGVILFYNWRLSYYVLAEHPEYGPIRCMKQSRRLMTGERKNLFRLDLSCWLLYGLAALIWYVTSGILPLWRMPSMAIFYAVFYNRMVYWKEPDSGSEPESEK